MGMLLLSTAETTHLVESLSRGIRPDLRGIDELRAIRIKYGTQLGYVEVVQGNTR
jgi:exosome complex RNA-binding protein Rrp42 (RNase PH superfamily)